MRKQYHFWPAERGYDAWGVDRLIALSSGLPVEWVAVDSIEEVDTAYWFDGSSEVPTVRKVAEHCKLIADVDTRVSDHPRPRRASSGRHAPGCSGIA